MGLPILIHVESATMSREELRQGSIQKIVRVSLMPSANHVEPDDAINFQGYGILRDTSGQEVFFVGSDVCDGDFETLETGTEVVYTIEPGPLARASQVRVAAKKQSRINHPSE